MRYSGGLRLEDDLSEKHIHNWEDELRETNCKIEDISKEAVKRSINLYINKNSGLNHESFNDFFKDSINEFRNRIENTENENNTVEEIEFDIDNLGKMFFSDYKRVSEVLKESKYNLEKQKLAAIAQLELDSVEFLQSAMGQRILNYKFDDDDDDDIITKLCCLEEPLVCTVDKLRAR